MSAALESAALEAARSAWPNCSRCAAQLDRRAASARSGAADDRSQPTGKAAGAEPAAARRASKTLLDLAQVHPRAMAARGGRRVPGPQLP
ncbi:MAG: hypothetical protein U5K43_06100 [Halofilum sp. (in: g-proteobacteria)]|nr:hypothetical protein [Halofilum sp. (in: g-proteobacteria)]